MAASSTPAECNTGSTPDEPEARELGWTNVAVRVALNAVTHPLEYSKVLMQIGYEPFPPYKAKNFMMKDKYYYPGVFAYLGHIRQVDGFFGCYRGMTSKIWGNMVSGVVYRYVDKNIKFEKLDGPNVYESRLDREEKLQKLAQDTCRDTAARTAAIIVSHPFHVITIRTMAQFIGGEHVYGGLFSSLKIMYQTEGLKGFFTGLVPRLICDIGALWLGNIVIHLVNTYIIDPSDEIASKSEFKKYVRACVRFLSSSFFYPFQVVSSVMAVTNSGLDAGSPPRMMLYDNWMDCYTHLNSLGQLKRGSSLVWRAYGGSVIRTSRPVNLGSIMKSDFSISTQL